MQVGRIEAEQIARRAIGENDRVRVNERNLGQRVGQRPKQLASSLAFEANFSKAFWLRP